MRGLDRFRLPEGRGTFVAALAVMGALLLVMAGLGWWQGAPIWRLPLLVVAGALAGGALARWMVRDARRAVGKGPKR